MKFRFIAILAAALAAIAPASAADAASSDAPATPKIKPYGFIRSFAFYDSRVSKALTEDIFYFIPLDEKKVAGNDLNAVGKFNFQALTTRLGLDFTGFRFGNTQVSGKIETDFYCLNSSGNTATLRMRQAYVNLLWDNGHAFVPSLKIGQGWHPLAADMPNVIDLETGAPFSPFSRSAQIMFQGTLNGSWIFNAGFIEHMQYRSAGPSYDSKTRTFNMGVSAQSNVYQRHAILPEVYLGVSFTKGGFLGRIGASALSIRPRFGYVHDDADPNYGKKFDEWLTTFNPFIYLQYTADKFQVKAKSVFAQAGEHMQLNGGYAVCGVKDDGFSAEYTPTRSSVSFVSAQYGKKLQLMCMLGYMKNLGTAKDITGQMFFSGNGFADIDQMFRATPTLAYNLGKLQFAVEYNLTGVRYGDVTGLRGKVDDNLHWVMNHRILGLCKFTF